METTRHVITARLGQSKASAVLLIPCEIRPRSKGTAEARASMCYVDVCIARSIVMASVGLPFLAMFHWYRSLGVTHRGNSWMTLRSWVRTMVVAKRQFSDPVIFDKLGCKVFVWSIAMAPLASWSSTWNSRREPSPTPRTELPRGEECYVDICIARSTEMASVGLPFLATFHFIPLRYHSYEVRQRA